MSPDTSLILNICPVQSERLFSSGDLMMQGLPLTTGVNGKVILRFLDGVSIPSLQNKHRGDPMSIFPKGFYVMAGLPEFLGLLRGDTAVMSGLLSPTHQLLPLIIVLSPLHSGDGIFPPHTTQKSTQQKRRHKIPGCTREFPQAQQKHAISIRARVPYNRSPRNLLEMHILRPYLGLQKPWRRGPVRSVS